MRVRFRLRPTGAEVSLSYGHGTAGRRGKRAISGFSDSRPLELAHDAVAVAPTGDRALHEEPASAMAGCPESTGMEGRRAVMQSRLVAHGHEPMGERDLVELLLFETLPLPEVKALARRLVAEFGDLGGIVSASRQRILKVEGATDQVFLKLKIAEAFAHRMARARVLDRCVIASWEDLMLYCKTVMAHRVTEQVRVLYLNRRNMLIADEAQGQGTVDHVPVYPREIVRRALEIDASAVILVHNHPSGDPEPSYEDVQMTARIEDACRAVGIAVHDHLVIGKDRDASLRAMGLMKFEAGPPA